MKVSEKLKTGISAVKNVGRFSFGAGNICTLPDMVSERKQANGGHAVFLIDKYFQQVPDLVSEWTVDSDDFKVFVDSDSEPKTAQIDRLATEVKASLGETVSLIIGIGGGTTLDTAKALSNLMTNPGSSEQYQGWDLVKNPGTFKIGVPTISGTGAEATRTCVMTNEKTGLKLGMNSDHTVFDRLILDPELTKTVPRNQYFYTGMDAFIHCVESLSGSYRHPIGDAFSQQVLQLCDEVFSAGDMMSLQNREKLMTASYLGGSAIAMSYVGIVHPFSAALSVVLGIHHCEANCIAMRGMKEFYPSYFEQFWSMAKNQGVEVRQGVCADLSSDEFDALYQATIIHEKPLINALGSNFRSVLTPAKAKQIFLLM